MAASRASSDVGVVSGNAERRSESGSVNSLATPSPNLLPQPATSSDHVILGSSEYRTVVLCTEQLETALLGADRKIVHFLHRTGFITDMVHEEVLNPQSMLNEHQRAGQLATGIRKNVKLNAQSYYTLLNFLRQSGGMQYSSIVDILEREYERQQRAGWTVPAPQQSAQYAVSQPSPAPRAPHPSPGLTCGRGRGRGVRGRGRGIRDRSPALGHHTSQLSAPQLPPQYHTSPPSFARHTTPQHYQNYTTPQLSPALPRYGDYLKSCYSAHSVTSDDKLSIAPCTKFISLALIQKEWGDKDAFSRSTFHGGVDEIVASKTPLALDALVTPDSQFVLVEGPPGIGKSTLCWELCTKCGTLESLQCFKIVLLLKLRERRVKNATKLSEIFFHRDEEFCQSVVKEVYRCEGDGVLLILDGFDEMPTSLVEANSSLIMEILTTTCLPRATRLVTSRPSALHHKTIFPKDHKHVEILGFTNERKVEFADIAFKSEPDVSEHFKTFVSSNPIINSLMYIPVNCAIIAQVFKDIQRSRKQQLPKTMTQLYTTLVLVLIRRHMIGKGQWGKNSRIPSDLKSLPKDVLSALKRVSELAHRGLFEKDAQIVFTAEDVGEGFQHLGLLSEAKEMYVLEGAKSSYSFPHLSIQEFLAALYIACNASALTSFISKAFDFQTVAKFVAGLVGCSSFPITEWMKKDAQVFFRKDYSRLKFMVHCLYEAQDSCKALEGHVFPGDIKYESHTPLDMYVFGYALVHAPIQWKVLDIRGYSDVSQLVNGCKGSNQVLSSISKLTMFEIDNSCLSSISKFGELPSCLLEQVSECMVSSGRDPPLPPPTAWMSSLHHLQSLSLYIESSLEDSLYQSIGSYPNLSTLWIRCSDYDKHIDIKALSESIASSHSLEHVEFTRSFDSEPLLPSFKYCGLMEATLSCPTLKTFTTRFPFVAFSGAVSPHLQSIRFILPRGPGWGPQTLDCLYCIADLCKMPSMRTLEIFNDDKDYNKLCVDTFAVLLNHFLHSNPSFTELYLDDNWSWSVSPNFSRALRTHPSLLSWKHSKSLTNLSCLQQDENTVRSSFWHRDYYHDSFRRGDKCLSCPDLLEMQSLHTMHPLLHKALRTWRLYYHKNAA